MSITIISKRYADSIYSIIKEKNLNLDKIIGISFLMSSEIEKNEELKKFIESPNFSIDKKLNLFSQYFSGLSQEEKYIFEYIITKDKLSIIKEIAECLVEIEIKSANILRVEAYFAVEPSEIQKNKIIEKLKNRYNKNIELIVKVDKELLGGVKLKIEDIVIDGSIKHWLNIIKKKF